MKEQDFRIQLNELSLVKQVLSVTSDLLQATLKCFLYSRWSLICLQLKSPFFPPSSNFSDLVGGHSCTAGRMYRAWLCTLKLALHHVQKCKSQACHSIPAAGTHFGWMRTNWCVSDEAAFIFFCRRHLRRWKASTDLLSLCSCFIVLRHVAINIYLSAYW